MNSPFYAALLRLTPEQRELMRSDPVLIRLDLIERLQGRSGLHFGPIYPRHTILARPDDSCTDAYPDQFEQHIGQTMTSSGRVSRYDPLSICHDLMERVQGREGFGFGAIYSVEWPRINSSSSVNSPSDASSSKHPDSPL